MARNIRLYFFQNGDGGTDLPRRAVATLETIVLDERRLHGVQIARLTKTFDGGDFVTFMHDRKRQTGIDATTIDHDSTCTALAMVASLFGSGEMQVLPESVKEGGTVIECQAFRFTVDLERYFSCAVQGSILHVCGTTKLRLPPQSVQPTGQAIVDVKVPIWILFY